MRVSFTLPKLVPKVKNYCTFIPLKVICLRDSKSCFVFRI